MKEITSLQHPLVKHLVRLRQNHDYREEHQTAFIEGMKLVGEICPYQHTKTVLVYDPSLVPSNIYADEVIIVSEPVMEKISGVRAPEGICAEVTMPLNPLPADFKRLLVCDGISDPGNLGALIRTGLALGWDGIFIVPSSCDPFNEKAIRASKGAIFRFPLVRGTWDELRDLATNQQLNLLVADLKGISLQNITLPKRIALVMSHESHGPSLEAQGHQKVTIPLLGDMESLNVAVAGGILMYELKQDTKHG